VSAGAGAVSPQGNRHRRKPARIGKTAAVRKILLTMVGTLSIAATVMAHPVATHGGYSQARVLEPGSRGTVVEV
jgi:hypothetical protein